jgi:hypothetical protein
LEAQSFIRGIFALASHRGPIRSALKWLASVRYMASSGIAEVRHSDLDFDKAALLAKADKLFIVMPDGFRFFDIYQNDCGIVLTRTCPPPLSSLMRRPPT